MPAPEVLSPQNVDLIEQEWVAIEHPMRKTWRRRPVPTDFHLFDLTEVDLLDPGAVVEFARRTWVSPLIPSDFPVGQQWPPAEFADRHGIDSPERDEPWLPGAVVQHFAEIATRMERLRGLVAVAHASANDQPTAGRLPWLPDGDEDETHREFVRCLNAGLSVFSVEVRLHDDDEQNDAELGDPTRLPSAYNVACLAIANDLAIDAPYRRCEDETCGRIFVRQRGRAQYSPRLRGVRFCSDSHARSQAQREKRRRARTKEEGR